MRKVLAFVGTRADLFPLGPVLAELSRRCVLHVSFGIGLSGAEGIALIKESMGQGISAFCCHDLGTVPRDDSSAAFARAAGELCTGMDRLLSDISPDMLLVLGDRWELMQVVLQAVIHHVPVLHLHGGETSEGAVDERFRHALTKLSDLHAVATPTSANRVLQLGEDPAAVVVTGAPGLDRFRMVEPMTNAEFIQEFGVDLHRPVILLGYHAVTVRGRNEDPGATMSILMKACREQGGTVIVTDPGVDPGRDDILAEIEIAEAENDPLLIHRRVLGNLYPRVMATVDAMVGNSSSGIIEAASFGLPVLNVGIRQQGRECSGNVVHVAATDKAVRGGLDLITSTAFRSAAASIDNVYGDGYASVAIADLALVAGAPEKRFHELRAHTCG